MPSMTLNTIGFDTYQPDPEDLCSLCGGNFGKAAMIECKDRIHICMECIDLLGIMKRERDDKKRDEVIQSILDILNDYDFELVHIRSDQKRIATDIVERITSGMVPHIRID